MSLSTANRARVAEPRDGFLAALTFFPSTLILGAIFRREHWRGRYLFRLPLSSCRRWSGPAPANLRASPLA